MDTRFLAPRGSHAYARLRVDSWGRDGGIREELVAEMKMKKKHRVYISRVVGNQGALIPRKYGCCYSLLSLSRPGFFGERQCQLSCGFHNFRFIKVTEAASSCVMDVIFRSEFTGAGNDE